MYQQRNERRPLAESPTDEYRYCLDALIATKDDTEKAAGRCPPIYHSRYHPLIGVWGRLEDRTAELAGRLFEKWIEIV